MSDKGLAERLQPALLDRLTDENPTVSTEPREDRVIDVRRLREIVQRDLTWLLNSNNNETRLDVEAYPNVASSVVNYGIKDTSGMTSTTERAEEIRKIIRTSIQRFEPRIRAETLEVDFGSDGAEDTRSMLISFNIRGEMWAQPMPLELYLRSQVNVTTGEVKLERRG